MGLLGIDANKATSTLTNAQVSSQYGAAVGGATAKGAVGGGMSGLIFSGKVGKGASVVINVPPPEHSPDKGIVHLEDNQSLSNQGFSTAAQNAAGAALSIAQWMAQNITGTQPGTLPPQDQYFPVSESSPSQPATVGNVSFGNPSSPAGVLQSIQESTGLSMPVIITIGIGVVLLAGFAVYKLRK